MPEPTQITFTWAEVAELLIKKAGIHEGKWVVLPEFMVNAGVLASAPAMGGGVPLENRPGAAILLNSLQLTKAAHDIQPPLVVDAAKVNPKI